MPALWTPSAEAKQTSQLNAFCTRLKLPFGTMQNFDFAALHRFSVEQRETFWSGVWKFCNIIGRSGQSVLADPDDMQASQFFPAARLNYAENLLEHNAEPTATALVGLDENGDREQLSWDELARQVDNLARHFEASGLGAGDRVAAALPNGISAAVAMLACAKLGAVWCSCSPDFGEDAMFDRFGQIEPTLLLGCTAYSYGGKEFRCSEKMTALAERLPSNPRLLLEREPLTRMRTEAPATGAPLPYTAMPFSAPLFIMFSSGTTGPPKCIVHSIGGTLLKQRSEHALHCDLSAADTLMFYTTCGWMMWNWLLGALAGGTTLVLYDGAPFHPNSNALLQIAEQEQLTVLGISPGWLSALAKNRLCVAEEAPDLQLRALLSTGSPLPEASFYWVAEQFGDQVQLSSISGGTDILGCFAMGNPWQSVFAGEIQGPALGMALEFFDDAGTSLTGEKGELVCTRSFPSQPIGFWNDADDAKYSAAYFERYPNVWHHGDFGEIDTEGGVRIHGRSDAVLNRGGVRIGTAEIYRQLEGINTVLESVVVAAQQQADTRILLFVRLAENATLTTDLRERIRTAIREGASPRHTPDDILQVNDIPRTRSGKIVELAVTAVVNGDEVRNTGALANPEALEEFKRYSQPPA